MGSQSETPQPGSQPATAGSSAQSGQPKKPFSPHEMYHPMFGHKKVETQTEYQVSLADGWSDDPNVDPSKSDRQAAEEGSSPGPGTTASGS